MNNNPNPNKLSAETNSNWLRRLTFVTLFIAIGTTFFKIVVVPICLAVSTMGAFAFLCVTSLFLTFNFILVLITKPSPRFVLRFLMDIAIYLHAWCEGKAVNEGSLPVHGDGGEEPNYFIKGHSRAWSFLNKFVGKTRMNYLMNLSSIQSRTLEVQRITSSGNIVNRFSEDVFTLFDNRLQTEQLDFDLVSTEPQFPRTIERTVSFRFAKELNHNDCVQIRVQGQQYLNKLCLMPETVLAAIAFYLSSTTSTTMSERRTMLNILANKEGCMDEGNRKSNKMVRATITNEDGEMEYSDTDPLVKGYPLTDGIMKATAFTSLYGTLFPALDTLVPNFH
jgi:hypothetical protein